MRSEGEKDPEKRRIFCSKKRGVFLDNFPKIIYDYLAIFYGAFPAVLRGKHKSEEVDK